MRQLARGYIASGEFKGYRTPQHIQNQIIKDYCDHNNLLFVLSRAEYWINGATNCQLWASLKEGYKHIVFFSLWQLPEKAKERKEIFKYCLEAKIELHFATERIRTNINGNCFDDMEMLIQINSVISIQETDKHLDLLRKLL